MQTWAEGLLLEQPLDQFDTLEGFCTYASFASNVVTEIVGPSSKRVGLIIFGGVKQNLFVGNDKNIDGVATGIPISTNNNILELYLWRHGKLVQKPWFGIVPAAGGDLIGAISIMRN